MTALFPARLVLRVCSCVAHLNLHGHKRRCDPCIQLKDAPEQRIMFTENMLDWSGCRETECSGGT